MNIKEKFAEYKSLKSRGDVLATSIFRTNVIREFYFSNNLAILNPLFQKLIKEEREDMFELLNSNEQDFIEEMAEEGTPFSQLNTLLLIKLSKEVGTPLTDPIGVLYEEENLFSNYKVWQKRSEKFFAEKYGYPDLDSNGALNYMVNQISAGVELLHNLSEAFFVKEEPIKPFEAKVDHIAEVWERQQSERTDGKRITAGIELLFLTFLAMNSVYKNEFEVKYYMERLQPFIIPENNFYWFYKFIEKEILIDETFSIEGKLTFEGE